MCKELGRRISEKFFRQMIHLRRFSFRISYSRAEAKAAESDDYTENACLRNGERARIFQIK